MYLKKGVGEGGIAQDVPGSKIRTCFSALDLPSEANIRVVAFMYTQ